MSIKFNLYPLTVLIIFLLIFTKFGKTVPTNYDQRQDGHLNVHAKLDNLLFVIVPSRKQMNNLAELAGLLAGSKSEQSLFRHPLSKGHQRPDESDGTYRIEFLDFRNQDQNPKEHTDFASLYPFIKKDSNKISEHSFPSKARHELIKSLPEAVEKHKEPYKVEILTLQNDVSKNKGEPMKNEETMDKEGERRKEPYKVEIINLDDKLPMKSNKSEESLDLDHINITENPERKVDVVIVEGAKVEARKAKQYGFLDSIRKALENDKDVKGKTINRNFKEIHAQTPTAKNKKLTTFKRKNDNDDVLFLSSDDLGRKHPHQGQLKLIGDGAENCGPLRHRNKAGICVFD